MGNDPSSPCGTTVDPYDYPTFDDEDLPRGLKFSLKFLTPNQKRLCRRLSEMGQGHFFDGWEQLPPPERVKFCEHLETIDASLPDGGLELYIDTARRLMDNHRLDRNPLQGWVASVPSNDILKVGTEEMDLAERWGVRDMGKLGFVLNATQMGTDMGYNDALVMMPVELTTNASYLQFYIQHILAIQNRFAPPKQFLPLCIVTSPETRQPIVDFLKKHHFFGMTRDQITILVAEVDVPYVETYKGKLQLDVEKRVLSTQPDGDGCIHALMRKHGVTQSWLDMGIQFVYFFEGADSLALQALPYMLYVTKTDKLVLNFLAVPRKAKAPADAMVKMTTKEKGLSMMINVGHRRLDEFLQKNQYFAGDHMDKQTGMSPFPASTHTMLMLLESYHEILDRTKGVIPGALEPVQAKDAKNLSEPVCVTSRVTDIANVLNAEETELIGITCMEADFCYAPVKVSPAAGFDLHKQDMPVHTAGTAETALYALHRRLMQQIGCVVETAEEQTFLGLPLTPNPNVVLHPTFCLFPSDYKDRFPEPKSVRISKKSSMVVRGAGVLISSLDLDGCVLIDCDEGYNAKVNGRVWNSGWEVVSAEEAESNPVIGMRGYKVDRVENKMVQAGESPSSCAIL